MQEYSHYSLKLVRKQLQQGTESRARKEHRGSEAYEPTQTRRKLKSAPSNARPSGKQALHRHSNTKQLTAAATDVQHGITRTRNSGIVMAGGGQKRLPKLNTAASRTNGNIAHAGLNARLRRPTPFTSGGFNRQRGNKPTKTEQSGRSTTESAVTPKGIRRSSSKWGRTQHPLCR